MKRLLVLATVLFMLSPLASWADGESYGSVGVGTMSVHGISPSNIERQIAKYAGPFSSSSIKDRSRYNAFSLGHCVNEYWCIEGSYIQGAEFNTSTIITNPFTGTINVGGTVVNLSSLPASITVRQEATVSAGQLSILGKVPVTDWFELFCRVGAYDYRIKVIQKILLPQNIFLAEEGELTGVVPMASIGFNAKTAKNFGLRFEGTKTGKVDIVSFSLFYRWH